MRLVIPRHFAVTRNAVRVLPRHAANLRRRGHLAGTLIGGELQVAAPSTTEREIIVKPPQDLGWTTNPPSAPVKPATLYEHFCSAVEGKSN